MSKHPVRCQNAVMIVWLLGRHHPSLSLSSPVVGMCTRRLCRLWAWHLTEPGAQDCDSPQHKSGPNIMPARTGITNLRLKRRSINVTKTPFRNCGNTAVEQAFLTTATQPPMLSSLDSKSAKSLLEALSA